MLAVRSASVEAQPEMTMAAANHPRARTTDNLPKTIAITFFKQTVVIISIAQTETEIKELVEELGDQLVDDGADVEVRPFQIETSQHGQRLDVALVHLLPEFSRSFLQQLIEAGAVTLAGARATKPSSRVKAGTLGSVELRPTAQSQAYKAEQIPLEILYSDEHLLVINKPAGLVVHPAPGNWSGTLLNALLGFDQLASTVPRAGIVHRLDKNTSGLMVVARSRSCMDALVQMIAARTVNREYLALTAKPWVGPTPRDVDAPIGRDPRNRLRMAVVELDRNAGKEAKTTLSVLDSNQSGTLVRCKLHTGRTHQIRVHMASIGLPILADEVYGNKPASAMPRQALHAFRLGFLHPVSHTAVTFFAPPPLDFCDAMLALGLRYNEITA
jgi:23S rRNA pseudouridine1911/1915/1917 synthase